MSIFVIELNKLITHIRVKYKTRRHRQNTNASKIRWRNYKI
jgi:hypothetical protein